jgi:hypothetical protein
MPSPFPGMDPYLEGALRTTLHHGLGSEIVRQLAPKLRPRYIALPVERFVMDIAAGVSVSPSAPARLDDHLTTPAPVHSSWVRGLPARSGGRRDACAPRKLAADSRNGHHATVMPEAVPHVTVEIRDTRQRQLVTAIEILSPTNKRGEGRREYVLKRQRVLLGSKPQHTRLPHRLAVAPHRRLHNVQQVGRISCGPVQPSHGDRPAAHRRAGADAAALTRGALFRATQPRPRPAAHGRMAHRPRRPAAQLCRCLFCPMTPTYTSTCRRHSPPPTT